MVCLFGFCAVSSCSCLHRLFLLIGQSYVAENFASVKRLAGKIVPEMTCNMSSGLQLNSTNPRPHYKTCLLELSN